MCLFRDHFIVIYFLEISVVLFLIQHNFCIVFLENLDKLEEMVLQLFDNVQDKKVVAPEWNEHPYGPEQLRTKGLVVPVKDLRNLNITFPIPDLQEYYKSGVSNVFSLF